MSDLKSTMAAKNTKRGYIRPRVAVHVTQQHIDEAMPKNSSHCMITEAIKDAIPNARCISTDLQTIRWTDPKKKLRYLVLTPQLAQVMLIAFDQGDLDDLKPFEFVMRPNQITKSGRGRQNHAPDDPDVSVETTPDEVKVSFEGAAEPAKVTIDGPTETPSNDAKVTIDGPAAGGVQTSPIVTSPPKPRRKYTFRKKLAEPEAPGAVPETLGGARMPKSVLARREFGLRVLRK